MDVRTIGMVMPLREVVPGKCILFSMHEKSEIGMLVQLGEEAQGILHFDARQDGIQTPTIYNASNFWNESALVIESARIVPVLAPEHVGFGAFAYRGVSLALYLTDSVASLRVKNGHYSTAIDLFSGRASNLDTARCAHTKAWYIEVVDVDGSFEPFHEFRCEPSK